MNGELAQIIFLVAHGNWYLNSSNRAGIDLPESSSFQFVTSVKFCRYKSSTDTQGLEVATSVSDWFEFLRSNKATRLWNIALEWQRQEVPEYVAASFSGGVPTAIQADLPHGFERWVPQWKTGGPSKKPWFVEYRGLMVPDTRALSVQKLGALKDQLRHAILQADDFSKKNDMGPGFWSISFTNALKLLDSPHLDAHFYSDILPASGFSLEARQLLASAASAFVFGGMGSWNDMGFSEPDTQNEYNRVTQELYEAVKLGLIMASNSFGI